MQTIELLSEIRDTADNLWANATHLEYQPELGAITGSVEIPEAPARLAARLVPLPWAEEAPVRAELGALLADLVTDHDGAVEGMYTDGHGWYILPL